MGALILRKRVLESGDGIAVESIASLRTVAGDSPLALARADLSSMLPGQEETIP